MSKRILINATPAGEVWATFVENGTLEELFVESSRKQVLRGNIYRAHVTSIDNKLRAAFIDYGTERNGFISIKDIHPDAFHRAPRKERDFQVSDVIQVGQPLLVQLKKEEDGSKGAAFTTDITLASAYTVISPVSGGESTISRKITDAKIKRSLKSIMNQCDPDERYGVMVRTAAEARESHEVLADLQNQLRAWGFIQADFHTKRAPCLLYRESQLITRMIRDHFTDDVDEIILDDEEAYEDLKRYCEERLPSAVDKLVLYTERLPLFVKYKVEGQINQLTSHQIDLPSGGNISINNTEAATVFDINSSRQSGSGDQQQMFLVTNCEAAELIARQVRLRGIGGLIFVDFINMREMKHRKQVEKVFKEAVKRDRAHLEVGMMSRFCVLEFSRNRIQERSLSTTHTNCPTCSGSGYIPSPNVVAFKLINSLYALAEKIGPGRSIKGKLPVAHAMYLLNDKRSVLVDLEERYGVTVEIEADFTQSLLAPDPFMEAGRALRDIESHGAGGNHLLRSSKRRERRERPKSNAQQTIRETILKEKNRDLTAKTPQTIDVTIDRPSSDDEGFTPPQIVGFIPKAQLDRAEAASLLSQASKQSGQRSGFEGRPARGEQPMAELQESRQEGQLGQGQGQGQEEQEERNSRKRRRRRRNKGRDRDQQRSPQESGVVEVQGQNAPTQQDGEQQREEREQITESVVSERPVSDERAKRRAEARARNRSRRAQRLREARLQGQGERHISENPSEEVESTEVHASAVIGELSIEEAPAKPVNHKRNVKKAEESSAESAEITADEEAPKKPTRRKRNPKKEEEAPAESAETTADEEAPTKPTRRKRPPKKGEEAPSKSAETTAEEEAPTKPTRRKRSTKKGEEAPAESEVDTPTKKATTKKATTKKATAKKAQAKAIGELLDQLNTEES